MVRRNIIYLILSFLLSGILIAFLFSQIELKDLKFTFSNLFFSGLVGFVIFALTGSVLRAYRYKLLLRPYPPSFLSLFWVTLIRNLFVDLLPARIGSLSYIYLVNKRLYFPFERAASSFILAVIFDFLTLGPFLIVSLFAVGLNASSLKKTPLYIISSLFFLFFLLLTWKLAPFLVFCTRLYRKFLHKFRLEKKKIWTDLSGKLEKTAGLVAYAETKKTFLPIFFLSAAIRLAKYAALFFLLFSLIHSHGYNLSDLSFFKTVLGTTGAEFTSVLPVKGLAGFGTWESAWALTFNLLDFDKKIAVISGIGVHLITNIFEYSLGLFAIFILAFPLLRSSRGKK
ncbi:MAG: flippase-like domain-containing protein [Candidatus Aminicenantes bacterium]|nr:flippase-like domain-containing protein [Candidatus Aminicenantes bacterium]